jgi:hypothetical protein
VSTVPGAPSSVNYILSLSSDPLSGPYTTSFNATAGVPIQLRLVQMTTGPLSNVNVSFGDGSPPLNFTVTIGASLNIAYNYTTGGLFEIVVSPVPVGLPNATLSNYTMIVNVTGPPIYSGSCDTSCIYS